MEDLKRNSSFCKSSKNPSFALPKKNPNTTPARKKHVSVEWGKEGGHEPQHLPLSCQCHMIARSHNRSIFHPSFSTPSPSIPSFSHPLSPSNFHPVLLLPSRPHTSIPPSYFHPVLLSSFHPTSIPVSSGEWIHHSRIKFTNLVRELERGTQFPVPWRTEKRSFFCP